MLRPGNIGYFANYKDITNYAWVCVGVVPEQANEGQETANGLDLALWHG